jgi:hypothetical protein
VNFDQSEARYSSLDIYPNWAICGEENSTFNSNLLPSLSLSLLPAAKSKRMSTGNERRASAAFPRRPLAQRPGHASKPLHAPSRNHTPPTPAGTRASAATATSSALISASTSPPIRRVRTDHRAVPVQRRRQPCTGGAATTILDDLSSAVLDVAAKEGIS